MVTPGATTDGTMYIGHTNDGYGPGLVGPYPDEEITNLIFIPAANHSPNSVRRIFYDAKSGGDMGEGWDYEALRPPVSISQVPHTYGYLSSAYGIMNEHGLMCSEATDYARVTPSFDPHKRWLYSSELSNIALERCKTPVEAVDLIGKLIQTYGYYGYGETLVFANATEAWVMEMVGILDGEGGVFAVQKVPDGEVFAGGNLFRIGETDPSNPNQKISDNAQEVAMKEGWWDPAQGSFNFAEAYSAGEFTHPYHTLSRIWSIYNRIAPKQKYPAIVSDWKPSVYPFSIIPDEQLNKTEIFSLFRDHYEGTEWDLTKGPAAGPFGDPYRELGEMDELDGGADERIVAGAWAYPVSSLSCGYSYICEPRDDMPDEIEGILWFGFAQPYETCYMPVFAKVSNISSQFFNGTRSHYSREWGYWPFSTVTNWARLRYNSMIPLIQKTQHRIEGREFEDVTRIIEKMPDYTHQYGGEAAQGVLTEYSKRNAEMVIDEWWNLSDQLIVRFSNGMIWDPDTNTDTLAGYPDSWYNSTGYQYGPRVYRTDILAKTPGLVYTNTTIPISSAVNPQSIRSLLI